MWKGAFFCLSSGLVFLKLETKMNQIKLMKALIWGSLLLILISGGTLIILKKNQSAQWQLPVFGTVPAFQFDECRGEPFGLDNMRGKINIVDFVFTRCQSACPVMTGKMIQLYEAFKDNDNVQFVSISVDPDYDTLEVLRKYAEDHGVTDKRWVFLRAPIEKVRWIAEKGFLVSGDLPGLHSTKLILVDQKGRIRGYYDSYDNLVVETLKSHINNLVQQLP